MVLKKDGVWKFVNGTEEAPQDEGQLQRYTGRRDKALATIVLPIHPSLLYLLGEPEDPAAVWKNGTAIPK